MLKMDGIKGKAVEACQRGKSVVENTFVRRHSIPGGAAIQKLMQLLQEKKVAVEIGKDGCLICKSQEFVQFGRSQMPYVTLRIEDDELVLKVSTGVGVTARIAYSYGFEFLKSWNESHPGMAAHLSHDAIPLCRFAFTPPTTLCGLTTFVNDVLLPEMRRGSEFCARFCEGAWKYLD